jgi:hypothetical protein
MLFAFCLLGTTAAASVAVIVAVLRKAPEAYEDEEGLQVIEGVSWNQRYSRFKAISAKRSGFASRDWSAAKAFLHCNHATEQAQKNFGAKAQSPHEFPQIVFQTLANRSLRGSNPQPLP